MLTSNFTEIIQVVTNKMSTQTLDTISADDTRNISFMLLGYIRLIKSGFSTSNEQSSKNDDQEYFSQLKNVLLTLTESQSKKIATAKRQFLTQFSKKIQDLNDRLNAMPYVQSPMGSIIENLKNELQKLNDKIATVIIHHSGFFSATRELVNCSFAVQNLMIQNRATELNDYLEKTLHLVNKEAIAIDGWRDIEDTNEQCIRHASFYEMLTKPLEWG